MKRSEHVREKECKLYQSITEKFEKTNEKCFQDGDMPEPYNNAYSQWHVSGGGYPDQMQLSCALLGPIWGSWNARLVFCHQPVHQVPQYPWLAPLSTRHLTFHGWSIQAILISTPGVWTKMLHELGPSTPGISLGQRLGLLLRMWLMIWEELFLSCHMEEEARTN